MGAILSTACTHRAFSLVEHNAALWLVNIHTNVAEWKLGKANLETIARSQPWLTGIVCSLYGIVATLLGEKRQQLDTYTLRRGLNVTFLLKLVHWLNYREKAANDMSIHRRKAWLYFSKFKVRPISDFISWISPKKVLVIFFRGDTSCVWPECCHSARKLVAKIEKKVTNLEVDETAYVMTSLKLFRLHAEVPWPYLALHARIAHVMAKQTNRSYKTNRNLKPPPK